MNPFEDYSPEAEPDVPELFEACRGIRFHVATGLGRRWPPFETYSLDAGVYMSHKGALVIMCQGECFTKLTVDLTIYESNGKEWKLLPDEFFVKIAGLSQEGQRVYEALLRLGIFAEMSERRHDIEDLRHPNIDEPVRVSAGYERDYARRWRFTQCTTIGSGHERGYVVKCDACRAQLAARWERTEQDMLAQDSINRLKNMNDDGSARTPTRQEEPHLQNIPPQFRKRT